MADSDFLSYSSIYESFSKGPKSIYYGIGDEMLPGVILNVPQTDDDDEWGRTQRISGERTYDFIAKIYKTLFDPYNSIGDISLVPGEAGSEINVAKNVIRLVGRSGIDTGVFDLSVPSLTLGDVVVDGNDSKMYIGTGFEASEDTLKINTNFVASSDTTSGDLTYRRVSAQLYDDNASTYKFTISLGTQNYVFTETGLTMPVGASISASNATFTGNLTVRNIYPETASTYSIGSISLPFDNIYANFINTSVGLFTNRSNEWFLCGPDLKIYNKDSSSIVMSVGRNKIDALVEIDTRDIIPDSADTYNIGDSSNRYSTAWVQTLFATGGRVDGALTVSSLIPQIPPATCDIGTDSLPFNNIYANFVNSSVGLFSNRSVEWFLCGPNLKIYNKDSTELVMSVGQTSVNSRVTITTRDITPDSADTYNIGGSSNRYSTAWVQTLFATGGRVDGALTVSSLIPQIPPATCDIGTDSLPFENIYGNYMRADMVFGRIGLYSDSTSQWNICGPNLKIRVYGDAKIGVCATYIQMYDDLYVNNVYPMEDSGIKFGSSSLGFDSIWLIDQVTSAPVKVYVSGGVLHP